jgi:hypothetical protein
MAHLCVGNRVFEFLALRRICLESKYIYFYCTWRQPCLQPAAHVITRHGHEKLVAITRVDRRFIPTGKTAAAAAAAEAPLTYPSTSRREGGRDEGRKKYLRKRFMLAIVSLKWGAIEQVNINISIFKVRFFRSLKLKV